MIPAIPPLSASAALPAPLVQSSGGTAASGFGQLLGQAIDSLQGVQTSASTQAQQVASGSANLGNAMVASTESLLTTQLAVALRNGAVGAVNQIMSTQF